jgi:hypothetical protein
VASSIQRLVLTTPPRTAPTRRDYETDDFLSRPLSTLKLHCDGYSHWVGSIHSTWIRTTHFSFVMAWIRKGLGICFIQRSQTLHCICIGFADTQSPPSSTLVPRHFFSALGGSLHLGYREVGYVRRFAFSAWDGLARPGLRFQGLAWLGYGLCRMTWRIYGYVDV